MNPTRPTVTEAVKRLKAVLVEIPGTQLSLADASRLSGLGRTACRVALEALEDARLITRARNGLFIRLSPDSHY